MISIAVAEHRSGALRNALSDTLHQRGLEASVFSCRAGDIFRCDLLVCSDIDFLPAQAKAKTLIITENIAASAAVRCISDAVITCGLGCRNTLTPSSLLTDGGMATLQREISTLSGGICDPKEIPLNALSGSPIQRLLLAAVLLTLE